MVARRSAAERERIIVRLDNRLGDGETKANPAHFTAAPYVEAREGLQDAHGFLLRNPCPLSSMLISIACDVRRTSTVPAKLARQRR